jgi:hypothetical protein
LESSIKKYVKLQSCNIFSGHDIAYGVSGTENTMDEVVRGCCAPVPEQRGEQLRKALWVKLLLLSFC